MTVEELIDLARGNVLNTPPFAVYSPDVVLANGGARSGSGKSEFDMLKDSLFYRNIDDLRGLTAEKFSKWRIAAAGKSGSTDSPPRAR